MLNITLKHGSTDKVTTRLRKILERGGPDVSWPELLEQIMADCDIQITGFSNETKAVEEVY